MFTIVCITCLFAPICNDKRVMLEFEFHEFTKHSRRTRDFAYLKYLLIQQIIVISEKHDPELRHLKFACINKYQLLRNILSSHSESLLFVSFFC